MKRLDTKRFPEVVVEVLHEAFVPVWSLPIGLAIRPETAGLRILDRHGSPLALLPWERVPYLDDEADDGCARDA